MSDLTPAMDTALAGTRVTVFGALRVDLLDGRNFGLLDGAGEVTFSGMTFKGKDATFGVLSAVDEITDGAGDEAPGLSFTLHPSDLASATDLSSPANQGSRVRLFMGVVSSAGAVVADPYLLFDGELDSPDLVVGESEFSLELECVSALERLFDNDEGARLNDAFHKSIWPGEEGLKYVSHLTRTIIWGPGHRPPGITYGTSRRRSGGGARSGIGPGRGDMGGGAPVGAGGW